MSKAENTTRISSTNRSKQISLTIAAWLFVACCIFIIIYFGSIGLHNLFLSTNNQYVVEKINILDSQGHPVSEHAYLTRDEVLTKTELKDSNINIFDLSPKRIRRILEKNNAVESVTVKRKLPNEISIYITEKSPIARIKPKGYLMDKNGFILPPGRKDLKNLPWIIIAPGAGEPKPGESITKKPENFRLKAVIQIFKLNYENPFYSKWIQIDRIIVRNDDYMNVYLTPSKDRRIPEGIHFRLKTSEIGKGMQKAARTISMEFDKGIPLRSFNAEGKYVYIKP